jgi:hypothetical protein
MSYQLRHLQLTIHYIVEQLKYNDDRYQYQHLSASTKRRTSDELLAAIDPLQSSNPKNIAINPANKYLTAFFDLLAHENIIFPEQTTYLLKREGLSYELHDGNRKEIYNRSKIRADIDSRRISEKQQLRTKYVNLEDEPEEDDYQMEMDQTPHYTPHYATLADFIVEPPQQKSSVQGDYRAKL